jgi:tRNA/rRNA methyltransferase
MLSEQHRAELAVVLVRARNPNNIGAVARAMHGFGFTDLRIVNEYEVAYERAKSAVDASDILATARTFATVAEAIADCHLVVGTTAVGERKREHPLHTLAQAGELIRATPAGARIALLFGSEKTGLRNEEFGHCNWLMTIPMHDTPGMRHASMNLGQAVAVCLYELIRNPEYVIAKEASLPAQAGDLERIADLLGNVLATTGYAEHRPSFADPTAVRRLILRLNLDQSDARRWIGILRRLLWKLNES